MRYGSVCSGIEAASVAWEPLGWKPQWFAEIDKFPSAVLSHRFPHVPNHGDMTRIPDDAASIDLLVGGTPCQSFSVAGLRGGMADERGNLALEYCRLAGRFRPRWLVWENVPGVLSSNDGRDFGSIVGALVELGYRCAWRVLDAQYFGVPQRRRRVFLVGRLGGPATSAAAVLFERHSLSGNPPPSQEAWADAAPGTREGAAECFDWQQSQAHLVTPYSPTLGHARVPAVHVSQCLTTGTVRRYDAETETLIPWDPNQITSSANRSNPQPGDPCHTLPASPASPAIACHRLPRPTGLVLRVAAVAAP